MIYTITEYSAFVKDNHFIDNDKYVYLPAKQFELLKNFVLSSKNDQTSGCELMTFAIRKNLGEVIVAQNYVGVIVLKDGTIIEILPKINNTSNQENVKQLLVKMLRCLRTANYKSINTTSLNTRKMPLFEIFIRLFIDEVNAIVTRGLSGGYNTIADNEHFFKGKLIVSQHIKQNFVHKERFFVEYDIFNYNKPENRLLKSALKYLQSVTKSAKNKASINTLLATFDQVPLSTNYSVDFQQVVTCRNNMLYRTALSWAKVFLQGQSFTNYSGTKYGQALLFDMNDLFEAYVSKQLKKLMPNGYTVSLQDKGYYLFESQRSFALRPDIVVRKENECCILDTKWKIIKSKNDISQADMYQMYAYHKKYCSAVNNNMQTDVKCVILLYPSHDSKPDIPVFSSADNVKVKVYFVDLLR